MIRQTCFHCRGDSQRLMNPAEVVVHEIQGHGMTMILNFLAESVCQTSETAHSHSHAQVLPLHVRGADVLRVRLSAQDASTAPDARCGAVTALREVRGHTVNLDQHCVINTAPKRIFHGIGIDSVTVSSELAFRGDPACYVLHECMSSTRATI